MKTIFSIDRRKNQSVLDQITSSLKTYILSNTTAPGDRLPSVKDIAKEYDVDSKEIETYYNYLIEEGFVDKIDDNYHKATQSFIINEDDSKNISLSDWLSFVGLESSRETLSIEEVSQFKFKRIKEFECLDNYIKIENLIDFGGNKLAYMIAYVSTSVLPKNSLESFRNSSITQTLQKYTKDKLNVERYLSITEAPIETLKILNINKTTPVLSSYQYMSNDYHELILYSELFTNHETFFTFKKIPYNH